ncbi:MAG: ATP-binding protein [Thermomicrobiales bacterium]
MASRVVMMCGLSGSGKTTYAESLVAAGMARLSIDEYIHARYGIFGVDYDATQWLVYQQEADAAVRAELVSLMDQEIDVVVDLSFWNRAGRDEYKCLIEAHGAEWDLVYIKVDPSILPERLAVRARRSDANAFPVPPEMLAAFIAGFEAPDGEGERIIEHG